MAIPSTSSIPVAPHGSGVRSPWPQLEAIIIAPAILGDKPQSRSKLMQVQRTAVREGITEGLKYHHKKAMSRKFNPATQKEYRFKPRKATYQEWKRKWGKGEFRGRKGSELRVENLVKSGELRKHMTSRVLGVKDFKVRKVKEKALKGRIDYFSMFFKLPWPRSFSASGQDNKIRGRGTGLDPEKEERMARFRERKGSNRGRRDWTSSPPNVKKADIRNELSQWAPRDEAMAARLFRRQYTKVLRAGLSIRQKKRLRGQLLAEGIRIAAK